MRKKRLLSLLCAGAISVSLVGCSGDAGSSGDTGNSKGENMPTITIDDTKEFPDKYGTVLGHSMSYFGDFYLDYSATLNDGTLLFSVGESEHEDAIAQLYQNFVDDTSYEDFVAQLGSDWQKNKDYYTDAVFTSESLDKRMKARVTFLYNGKDVINEGTSRVEWLEYAPEVVLSCSFDYEAIPESFTELAKLAQEFTGIGVGTEFIADALAVAAEAGGENEKGGSAFWTFADGINEVSVGWSLDYNPPTKEGCATFRVSRAFNRFQQ